MEQLERTQFTVTPIMAQPKQLTLLFNLSRTAVGKFINEMLLTEEFKAGVTRISHNLTLVNVELFMEFLKSKDMESLKQGAMIMLKGKLMIDEYNEQGEFSLYQIDKLEKGEIDIYDLVAVITLNAFNKRRQSLEVL